MFCKKKSKKEECEICKDCSCRRRCEAGSCDRVSMKNSLYCVQHKCALECPLLAIDSSFCVIHRCSVGQCRKYCIDGKPICKMCQKHLQREDDKLKIQLAENLSLDIIEDV